jgi:hypothetical protein
MDWFVDFMRFLNLLEPGKRIISISKVFMWVTVMALAYTVFERPDDIVAVMTAVSSTLISTGNYMYRRKVQVDTAKDDTKSGS